MNSGPLRATQSKIKDQELAFKCQIHKERRLLKQCKEKFNKPLTIPSAESLDSLLSYRDGSLFWRRSGRLAGNLSSTGYRHIQIWGVTFLEHRVIFAMHNNNVPDIVDHKNRIRNDNRIENLRPSNSSLNQANRDKTLGTSKYKGVSWNGDAWRAVIQVNLEAIQIGRFHSEADAALAYNEKALAEFGEHARLNDV